MATKNAGIMVFKDVFDYYVEGEIDKDQFVEVMMLIYDTKWGNGEKENNIDDRDVRMIWRTLRHSIKKSVQNAKDYDTKQKKNNQDIQPNTEFEITPNKALNTQSETIPLPDNESVSNGQEIGENCGYSLEDIVRILTAYNIPENVPSNDLLIQDKYMEISRSFGINTGKLQAVQQHRFNTRLKITG